ncbi:MAG TPA: hypothetical protein PKU94_02345 [Candidatus Hydrothermia bacterium]|nr:hypothetical protein [Candidatus Hydrothermae bacterium]MDD3649012.1 hypothetical protein [Candidatus Hydrothermia bacterium]MDD5572949.1 hypothetical protein [Candidatus Hydrothermia bacterium]HOK22951.1 hypothetical protein [Candidatus Hydrothermia bacterium]HOL23789.1 hypothetical protein [Candidatus Hydrothermia bacterium]
MGKWSFSKIVFLLIAGLIACSRLPESNEPPTQPVIPVFEVFGYARCANCPVVEHALDSLKENYGDSIVVLEYHMRILGDTLSPKTIEERESIYGIGTAAPITIVHGEVILQGSEGINTELFRNYYNSIRHKEDSVLLNISMATDADSFKFTVSAEGELDPGAKKLYAFVTQDSIVFKQVGAPDTIFNNVVRFLISMPPEFPVRVNISKTVFNHGIFVALVQDTLSKKILSVAQRRFW